MNTGKSNSRIGLGTYRLGDKTLSACLTALEIGYRHIDTAALYRNEAQVYKAIKESSVKREDVFITSKIHIKDIKAENIKAAACKSLENLHKIDLLLLHAPTDNLVTAWEQMLEIQQWQEIGEVGVSNFDICHLQQLSTLPKWNQIEVTPYLQRRDLVKYCKESQIKIVAHSPLVKGKKLNNNRISSIAHSINITPPQLLIAWSLAKGYTVLPRSANPIHIQENFAATKVKLSPEIIKQLDTLEEGYATHPQHIDNQ